MSKKVVNNSNQFVTFRLGKEEYGIDIHKVTTIERMTNITRVPRTADSVRGVMSLRGEVVPVIDLRKRFNLTSIEETDESRIIIFKIEDVVLGMVVDLVTEVVTISEDSIEGATGLTTNDHLANYIFGVGKIGDRIVTILNLGSLIENSQD